MIDIKEVLRNPDKMKANVAARNVKVDVDQVIELYKQSLEQKRKLEGHQASANEVARNLRKKVDDGKRAELVKEGKGLKQKIATQKKHADRAITAYTDAASQLPNWMAPEVPTGSDDYDNKEISTHGKPTQFNFAPKDHLELGKSLDLIDFESGAKVAGSKFYFLKKEAVLLQHAIKSFAFRKAIESGFVPLHTPDIARNSVLQGVGFAPRGEESNTYELSGLDMSLVATAEIAVGGMHMDEVMTPSQLPLLYVAESHCFRREAGTAGRASKGLYRVHQFEKVELFAFTTPEQSSEVHDKILAVEEGIYQGLGLPYRVVLNCSGDLGSPAYKKYDIEAWMPGKGDQGEYGEVTSASNCTTYQSRRLNVKYKDPETRKNAFLHTLNGTAVALSRTLIGIMENYQKEDGSIEIPKALVPYMGMNSIEPTRGNNPPAAKGSSCNL